MTTTSCNYYYDYDFIQMTSMPVGYKVRIGENVLPVLALAVVWLTMLSTIDNSVLDKWKEIRYVICDTDGNPCINYKENPDYEGVV